jgi:hypothetical protein
MLDVIASPGLSCGLAGVSGVGYAYLPEKQKYLGGGIPI